MTLWDEYTLSESSHINFKTSWSQGKRQTFKISSRSLKCRSTKYDQKISFWVEDFLSPIASWELELPEIRGLKVDMRAFRYRVFIPKCHRNNSYCNWNRTFSFFIPPKKKLKTFWLENFVFLCNFVTKRHRHELSEGWKKFYWCQNHILILALYSSECGEHVSMSGCEVWTSIDGDRSTNVKIFNLPPPL